MFKMFKKKQFDVRLHGPTLEQIEELERLTGQSIVAILRESVHLCNWLCKERKKGTKITVEQPGSGMARRDLVFKL